MLISNIPYSRKIWRIGLRRTTYLAIEPRPRARSIHMYVLVLSFSISLSLSDGTLDGMPALVKNRYSDMVSSNKILHLLACTSKNSWDRQWARARALALDRPHPLLCVCASWVGGLAGQVSIPYIYVYTYVRIYVRTYIRVLNIGGF